MTRRPAFSLIELLTVVALMGVLAAIVLPSLNPGIHESLEGAARIAAGDLEFARSLAVANNSTYRLRFDAAQNNYVLRHAGSSASLDELPKSALAKTNEPADRRTVDFDELPHLGGANVKIVTLTNAAGQSLSPLDVEFGPLGSTVRADETRLWLSAGRGTETRYVAVRINPVTGLTAIEPMTSALPAGTSLVGGANAVGL